MEQRIARIGASVGAVRGNLEAVRGILDRLVADGFDSAELYASDLGVAVAGHWLPERLRELRRVCDERRLGYTLHAPIPIDLMDRENVELHRRAARLSIEIAEGIDATVVVFHAGRASPAVWSRDAEGLLAAEREELSRLGDMASAAGIRVAVENVSPTAAMLAGSETSYGLDPKALARQIERLDHDSVVACLDLSHANQGAGLAQRDLRADVAALAPFVGHLHVSDSSGDPPPPAIDTEEDRMFFGVGDMHAPLGTGGMDLEALAEVTRVRPGTIAVLELQETAWPLLGDGRQRLRAFADRVNALD